MFVFDADLRTVSATVREISAGIRAAQVDDSYEAVRGDEGAELLIRAIAADKAGDTAALVAIFDRAEEIDAAQPFGARIVDQLHALIAWTEAA
jgi:CelD/BcsL family acetyltransferase involved in cellulose biosynthesis